MVMEWCCVFLCLVVEMMMVVGCVLLFSVLW